MLRRLLKSVLLSFMAFLLFSGVALAAWEYLFPTTIVDTSNTTRAYYPVLLGYGGQTLVDAAKISSSGNDTNMQIGSTDVKYMMATGNVTAVIPSIPSGGVVIANLYTGYSPEQSVFAIITGSGGYVTVSDNASLEPSNNATFSWAGYFDTDSGYVRNLVYKKGAFRTHVSETVSQNITASILEPYVLQFTKANSDWVSIPDADTFTFTVGNPFSITGWVRFTDATSGKVVAKFTNTDGTREWTFGTGASDNLSFELYKADGTAYISRTTNAITAYEGTWIHIAATSDGSVNATGLKVYINAVQADVASVINGVYAGMTNTNTVVSLGAINAGAAGPLGGSESQIKVYSSELSQTEITNDYNGLHSSTNLVAWWKLEDGAGNPTDSSGNGHNATSNIADWVIDYTSPSLKADVSVSATGVSSGEHEIELKGSLDSDTWATGNALYFPGAVQSYVDAGAIYNASAKFWFSLWFMPTQDYPGGTGTNFFGKQLDANNYMVFRLTGTPALQFYRVTAGVPTQMNYTIPGGLVANTWYHLFFSTGQAAGGGAASNGARLRFNNGVASTNANADPLPNGGNFVIGDWRTNTNDGRRGYYANLVTGNDDLTLAEENALFNGIAPADAVDYWYMDEGSGVAINSYGTGANPGTATVNLSWTTLTYTGTDKTGRLCDFVIKIDDTIQRVGVNAMGKGISVSDNSSDWRFLQNDVMPYADNITITVGGTQQLYLAPNTMISGTNIPDRSLNSHNGTITWGSNSGIALSYGEMSSFEDFMATANITGGFSMPTAPMPATWFAAGENVANLPFYDAVSAVAVQTGKPVQTYYAYWIIGIAFGAFLGIVVFTRSALMAYIALVVVFAFGSSMTIIPAWIVFVMIIVGLAIMYLFRQVAY